MRKVAFAVAVASVVIGTAAPARSGGEQTITIVPTTPPTVTQPSPPPRASLPSITEGIGRVYVGQNPDGTPITVEVDRAEFRRKVMVVAEQLRRADPGGVYLFRADAQGNPVPAERCPLITSPTDESLLPPCTRLVP